MTKANEEKRERDNSKEVELYGEFHFKVDAKGRVALPSRFRKVLSKDLVVSRDLQGKCLYVFEEDSFTKWVDKLFEDKFGGYDESDDDQVRYRSGIRAQADGVEVDSSGRISLKEKLRDSVGIVKDVVITGNTGRFQIWDEKVYEETFSDFDMGIMSKKS